MNNNLSAIFRFIHRAEKLKMELRHSWTSDGRQESVAEHSWRVALMVLLISPHLKQEINLEKALTMALLHDIVEMTTGDIPIFLCKNKNDQDAKFKAERCAIEELQSSLPQKNGPIFSDLWLEFEERKTNEAKLVYAIDKIEAQIQHNEADISTWVTDDFTLIKDYLNPYCDFDEFIWEFKNTVQRESLQKAETYIRQK